MSGGATRLVMETTAKGRRVFQLRLRNEAFSYRAFPILPGELSRAARRAGMNAMSSP
jgi:hypothetical protein